MTGSIELVVSVRFFDLFWRNFCFYFAFKINKLLLCTQDIMRVKEKKPVVKKSKGMNVYICKGMYIVVYIGIYIFTYRIVDIDAQ